MSDITILVQGPIHPNCIVNIFNYLRYGNVVISCWDNTPRIIKDSKLLNPSRSIEKYVNSFLEFYEPKEPNSIQLVVNKSLTPKEVHDSRIYNIFNCYFQFFTTVAGLESINTKYTIKVRTDEYYTDLMPVVEKIKKSEEKRIVTTNTFFRKNPAFPWHPGDHLVAGTTENLKKVFNNCKEFCENGGFFKKNHASRFLPKGQEAYEFNKVRSGNEVRFEGPTALPCPVPEIIMGTSNILLNSDLKLDFSKRKEIMKDFFDCISVEELGWFLISEKRKVDYRDFLGSDTTRWDYGERKISILKSIEEIE